VTGAGDSSPRCPGPLPGTRITGFDDGPEPAPGIELARHGRPDGAAGFDDILEDAIDDVLIEDAQVPVGQEVFFQGFQFQDARLRLVINGQGPEIRQAGLRTDRGELRDLDLDLVTGELVGKGIDRRELLQKPGLGFFFGVSAHFVPRYGRIRVRHYILWKSRGQTYNLLVVEQFDRKIPGTQSLFGRKGLCPEFSGS